MKKVILLIIFVIYLFLPVLQDKSSDKLRIWVLNIGQGDAILVRTTSGKNILIDTGPDETLLTELGEVLPYFDRKIDYFIVSHPHYDHIGAVKELFDRYEVEKVIWFPVDYYNAEYSWLREYSVDNPEKFLIKGSGENFTIDNLELLTVWPILKSDLEERDFRNVNNASFVFLLKYKNFEVFFGGDSEHEQEEEYLDELKQIMLENNIDRVEYLKASHHCSDTSNSKELLEVLQSEVVTCGVGLDNKFGHPKEEVLVRLENMNVKIYRTDLNGRVYIVSNGEDYEVE